MIGFSHMWLLGALVAVGLPVAIHFMTRPRPRRIDFPAFQFLMEAAQGRQRLHRIRTFLILLIRSLAVLILVLLFARPYLHDRSAAVQTGLFKKTVVLIDATLSMQAGSGGLTLFDRARADAADLITGLDGHAEVGLIFMKDRPESLLPVLSGNTAALLRGLENAVPSAAAGSPDDALALAGQMLAGSGTIYIFSDFQQTSWQHADFSGTPHRIVLRPVIETAIENTAITDIRIMPANPVTGEPVEITCRIFNAAPDHRQVPVVLNYMGRRHHRRADLKPYGTTSVLFRFIPEAPGTFSGVVRLETSDGLQADNERYFRMDIQKSSVVLIMSDRDPTDAAAGAFYVKHAVAPEDKETGIRAMVRHSQGLDIDSLDAADTIILCPPVRLSESLAAAILSRVHEGRQLICFLEGRKAPAMLAALQQAAGEDPVFPFILLSRKTADNKNCHSLTRLHTSRTPLNLFAAPGSGDLSKLRFGRHYQTDLNEGRGETPLMYYPDGSAAMMTAAIGWGNAVFLNLPICPAYGNLAASPLFPALIHECLRLAGRQNARDKNHPGKPLAILVPQTSAGSSQKFRIQGPDGRDLDFSRMALGKYSKLTVTDTESAGIYAVYRQSESAGFGVVNIDPRESDTRLYPVRKAVNAGRSAGGETIIATASGDLMDRGIKSLWPHAGLLFAGLLAFEMLILCLRRKG